MVKKIYVLDDAHDRTLVYSILCSKSFTMYSYLKYGFHLPIVLISAVLSVLNGNLKEFNEDAINVLNISANALTALLLVISNQMQFESRASHFKAKSAEFMKMHREIEMYLLPIKRIEDIDDIFVKSIMLDYDKIVQGLQYDVPRGICKSVKKTYDNKRTLPNIIAEGSRKGQIYRQNSICSILENCPKSVYTESNEGKEETEVVVIDLDK